MSSSDARPSNRARIEITPGELFDRLTILDLKLNHMDVTDERYFQLVLDRNAIKDAAVPLQAWMKLQSASVDQFELPMLVQRLYAANSRLWEVEDRLRCMEAEGYFDRVFVEDARKVYKLNDVRSSLKRNIDRIFGVSGEVKCYAAKKRNDHVQQPAECDGSSGSDDASDGPAQDGV